MEKMKVIVTGGAGFIGSHVADALIAGGHRVVILDNLATGRRQNIPEKAEFHEVDIRSEDAARIVEEVRPQAMFHLAAQMDVRKSVYDPSFDADVNLRGMLNLLEAGRKSGLRKVVFSSTGGAIYGEQDVYPADEQHATWPISPYGIAKLASEKYLFFYHKQYGLDVTCLRYANVYGPRQNPHGEAGVVAIFSRKLLGGERPLIFGDGSITRDYVYVADVVRANLAGLGADGYVLANVGTGRETSVEELFSTMRDIIKADIDPIFEEPRPGEQQRSSIHSPHILGTLGAKVETPLRAGLEETIAWFRQEGA